MKGHGMRERLSHNEKVWRWTSIVDKDARDLTPDQREKLFAEVKRGPRAVAPSGSARARNDRSRASTMAFGFQTGSHPMNSHTHHQTKLEEAAAAVAD